MPMVTPPTGHVGPFAGLDVPWLLAMRAERRGDHPFIVWTPFERPAVTLTYRAFHDRVGALGAGLARRGIKPGEFVLIHLDNSLEALLAWYACVELGAIVVGEAAGRETDEQITVADLTGVGAQDAAIASATLQAAMGKGFGTEIES